MPGFSDTVPQGIMGVPGSLSSLLVCVVATAVTLCYGAKPKLRGGLENSKCATVVSIRGGVLRVRLRNLRVVSARVTVFCRAGRISGGR